MVEQLTGRKHSTSNGVRLSLYSILSVPSASHCRKILLVFHQVGLSAVEPLNSHMLVCLQLRCTVFKNCKCQKCKVAAVEAEAYNAKLLRLATSMKLIDNSSKLHLYTSCQQETQGRSLRINLMTYSRYTEKQAPPIVAARKSSLRKRNGGVWIAHQYVV